MSALKPAVLLALLSMAGCRASLPPLRAALGDSDLTWRRIAVDAVELKLSCHDAAFGRSGADLGFLRAMENSLNRALGPPGEVNPGRMQLELLTVELDCHVMTAALQTREQPGIGEGRSYVEVRIRDHEERDVALGSVTQSIPETFMWSPTAAAEHIMGEITRRLGRSQRIKSGTRWKLGRQSSPRRCGSSVSTSSSACSADSPTATTSNFPDPASGPTL